MSKETDEEVKELENTLKSSTYKPIESPIKKVGSWKFLKDKSGNKLTIKEYFTKWGNGIKNLTPEQRVSNERNACVISLIGFIASLIVMIIFRDKFLVSYFAYGLIIIFLGSIYSNFIKLLSLNQMLRTLKEQETNSINIDDLMNKVDVALDEGVIQK